MAAAEARTTWQRTVNRCFVQEDAKRAPKLACNQSCTSKFRQSDAGPASAVDGSDGPGLGFMPFNRNPSYFSLPTNARWWLQLDPNFEHQKGFGYGQLKAFEVDARTSGAGDAPKVDGFKTLGENVQLSHDVNSFSSGGMKMEELGGNCKIGHDFLDVKKLTEYYELMEMELVGGSVSKQSSDLSYDVDSCEKIPLWRKTEKDDLASFVEQKSLDLVENCDLPLTRKTHVRRRLSEQSSSSVGCDEMFVSLQDWGESDATSDLHLRANAHAGSNRGSELALIDEGLMESVTSEQLRFCSMNYSEMIDKPRHYGENSAKDKILEAHLRFCSMNYSEMIDKPRHYGEDSAKDKILEALCHSQTRAREAENAAKQANIEKEHIVKLFFKQASQLFAYKQWFRLLQLESSISQAKNHSNHPQNGSTLPPDAFTPWSPCKLPLSRHKIWRKILKGKRHKRKLPGCDFCKYAVVFALGLSLVGTGLLLGWTAGCLFPAF